MIESGAWYFLLFVAFIAVSAILIAFAEVREREHEVRDRCAELGQDQEVEIEEWEAFMDACEVYMKDVTR